MSTFVVVDIILGGENPNTFKSIGIHTEHHLRVATGTFMYRYMFLWISLTFLGSKMTAVIMKFM